MTKNNTFLPVGYGATQKTFKDGTPVNHAIFRQECLCDEIDPADIPCVVCEISLDLGVGAPPGCKKWPPHDEKIPSRFELIEE